MSDNHQHADLWAKFRALYPDTASGASEPKSARPGLEEARSLIRTCKEHGVGLRPRTGWNAGCGFEWSRLAFSGRRHRSERGCGSGTGFSGLGRE